MFAKFLDAVTRPAQQIAEATGRQIEREFQREANRAAQRLADRAVVAARKRTVSLFSALVPAEEESVAESTGVALMPSPRGGLFAPPE